jgi:hypothetical protein
MIGVPRGCRQRTMRGNTLHRTILNSAPLAMLAAMLLTGPCAAQNTPSPQSPGVQALDPKTCAPLNQREGTVNREGTVGGGPSLSDKLERGEGVLCPPRDADPEIAKLPQSGGRTPVIPPPGSPGGDLTVRPK